MKYLTRIRNAAQIVQVCKHGEQRKCGKDMNEVAIVENGGMVIGMDGNIVAVGTEADIFAQFSDSSFENDIDATGKSILPGFVDGHTHPVWSGDRVHEFAMKLAGASYMDVHKAGGGIGFTVRHTRDSDENELETLLQQRLDRMLSQGSTVVECKSGYGLDTSTEMKMLRVIHSVNKTHPVHCVSTYLGAHSVPASSTAAEYTDNIINEQLPKLVALRDAKEISPTFIDVFCEKGVFEVDHSKRILEAGQKCGLLVNFHGDELNPVRAAELGAELGATAISHLEEISECGIKAMAEKDVFATLLPTTAYVLRITPPPARSIIDGGVAVALGSDYNPNAHCLSMSHVMNLACVTMRMTMNEALVGATINAAGSLACADTHGSLEVGKRGDFVVIGSNNWQHVIYELVDPPIELVAIGGQPSWTRK